MPDVLIHLGDFERDAEVLRREFPDIPLYNVCGNCDFYPKAPAKTVVSLGPVRAFITHGHLWNAANVPPVPQGTILAHGHTHIPEIRPLPEGVTIFNPGSVALPKGGSSRSFGYFDGEALKHYTC